MIKKINELKKHVDLTSSALERVLDDYSHYVDTDQAEFLKGYLHSLRLDFEMAMTRGEASRLEIIVEDVTDLLDSAEVRLRSRLAQG